VLDKLDDACQDFKIDDIREILLKAPAEYQPSNEQINDLIWRNNEH